RSDVTSRPVRKGSGGSTSASPEVATVYPGARGPPFESSTVLRPALPCGKGVVLVYSSAGEVGKRVAAKSSPATACRIDMPRRVGGGPGLPRRRSAEDADLEGVLEDLAARGHQGALDVGPDLDDEEHDP